MRKAITQCVSVLLVCVGAVGHAAATDLGLITGGERGTYHQLGLDLKKLVKAGGINLSVYPSKGSVENIFAVFQRPRVQLGIVQSDVLAFVAGRPSHAAVTQIARNTRMVFPLHNEEIHVVARGGIGDFDQLAGKRVAVGREGSGSYLTASVLFKLAEVRPGELVPIDAPEALAQLKAGRIDAMLFVAGSPVRLLRDEVKATDGLALVPLSNKNVLEAYAPAEIPANVYEWQAAPVRTVAVKAVLVSRQQDCDGVGRFARQVAQGMDWLTKHGHPKWKEVDLDATLPGWEQYDCVQKYLGKQPTEGSSPSASARERNPIADAIKGTLDRK